MRVRYEIFSGIRNTFGKLFKDFEKNLSFVLNNSKLERRLALNSCLNAARLTIYAIWEIRKTIQLAERLTCETHSYALVDTV